jgi:hypothetical protein
MGEVVVGFEGQLGPVAAGNLGDGEDGTPVSKSSMNSVSSGGVKSSKNENLSHEFHESTRMGTGF